MSIEQRLKELGLTLPQVGGPLGNYVHAKRVGNLLYLSGKGPPDSPGTMPKASSVAACRSTRDIAMRAASASC